MNRLLSREPLAQADRAELAALEALPDDQIDRTDMPEVKDWTGFHRIGRSGHTNRRP